MNLPTINNDIIDTMVQGDRMLVLNPATQEMVEMYCEILADKGVPKRQRRVYLTTADSRTTAYNIECGSFHDEDVDGPKYPVYADYIKHVRNKEYAPGRAVFTRDEMKTLIAEQNYTIG